VVFFFTSCPFKHVLRCDILERTLIFSSLFTLLPCTYPFLLLQTTYNQSIHLRPCRQYLYLFSSARKNQETICRWEAQQSTTYLIPWNKIKEWYYCLGCNTVQSGKWPPMLKGNTLQEVGLLLAGYWLCFTMKMEVVCSSETLVNYHTRLIYIPEHSTLQE
jgi:hypothetical protein